MKAERNKASEKSRALKKARSRTVTASSAMR